MDYLVDCDLLRVVRLGTGKEKGKENTWIFAISAGHLFSRGLGRSELWRRAKFLFNQGFFFFFFFFWVFGFLFVFRFFVF
jgi:hypothetical protein